jgi:hypothetical protein
MPALDRFATIASTHTLHWQCQSTQLICDSRGTLEAIKDFAIMQLQESAQCEQWIATVSHTETANLQLERYCDELASK